MPKYGESKNFFQIPENAGDFEPGKGDFIIQKKDEKGKYWLSKPVFTDQEVNHEDLKYF
jgi:benzylsuccinate synthase